jgi:Domain of unknown function (DUF4214)
MISISRICPLVAYFVPFHIYLTVGPRFHEPFSCYPPGSLMPEHSQTPANRLKDVLSLEGAEFLGQAYLLMLGRPVDPEGFRNYDVRLRSGTSKLSILAELRASQEGRAYGANVPDPLVLLAQGPLAIPTTGATLQDLLRMSGAAFVDQGFLATIGRLPDETIRRGYIAKLNAGEDKLQILEEMIETSEGMPAGPASKEMEEAIRNMRGGLYPVAIDIKELLALDDLAFIDCAYKSLLKRAPDAVGMSYYLKLIRSGAAKMRVVSKLFFSAEGRKAASSLRGLRLTILQYWLASSRLTGWWYRPIAQVEGDTPLECRLRAVENALMRMSQDHDRESNELDTAVDDVARLLKALASPRSA